MATKRAHCRYVSPHNSPSPARTLVSTSFVLPPRPSGVIRHRKGQNSEASTKDNVGKDRGNTVHDLINFYAVPLPVPCLKSAPLPVPITQSERSSVMRVKRAGYVHQEDVTKRTSREAVLSLLYIQVDQAILIS